MFWNLEVITSTGKSLCIITQIQFNIILTAAALTLSENARLP